MSIDNDCNLKLKLIKRTLELAKRGLGGVSPNPMVGAVLVNKDGEVIGEGYHKQYGGPHAEVLAIESVGRDVTLEDATLYCSLEPCSHTNKQTPPCTDLIIQKKIKRVVVATLDPNPAVSGRGLAKLRESGIDVDLLNENSDCEEERNLSVEAHKLNEVFFKFISKQQPFVHLKWAQTLDGRVATKTYDAKWISSEEMRIEGHKLRLTYDAILVGVNTLIKDNPKLDVRYSLLEERKRQDDVCARNPIRVVVGNIAKLEREITDFNIFSDELAEKTIIFTPRIESHRFIKIIEQRLKSEKKGPKFFELDVDVNKGRIDLHQVLKKLAELKISSLLVEGGPTIITSFLREKLFDKLSVFLAPKILGEGINSVGELNILKMSDSMNLKIEEIKRIDDQIMISLQGCD
ncbi:MAG: bifunctional diaminohydroxyphosphoribosylaminopyrimidine deaminase/5-amino-6-(5-phosphoribosylamino)uracil reductase RibD [Oligoflexia bacterium]|nr:bifunctional diaminohydroxyphosphoribosylaminopyrimidine deaminase/5-amino-6-(5-phosphoribosylamino)uracil reductase RibD [Oligoflexia bacterium]